MILETHHGKDLATEKLRLQWPEEAKSISFVPKPVSLSSFGEWIRGKRVEKSLSQQELAKELRVSNSFLSKIENGEKSPPEDLLENLSILWHEDLSRLKLRARIVPDNFLDTIVANMEGFINWSSQNQLDPSRRIQVEEN